MRASHCILPSIIASLVLSACAPKAVSQSDLDTPEYHFRLGVRSLDSGDYTTAQGAFQRAVDLDKRFAPGWGGLGLAQAYLGNPNAKSSVDRGVSLDGKNADVFIFRGRYFIVVQNGGKWPQEAEQDLNKALQIDPGNESAIYYKGEANFYSMNFRRAESHFSQVVDMKGSLAGKADERWATTQKIVRARPGTDAGRKIAIKAQISRADLTVLFSEELRLAEVFSRLAPVGGQPAAFRPPGAAAAPSGPATPSDVAGTWAEPWIMEVLKLGIFEVDPSGMFYPEEPVTRVGYAMAVQRILTTATRDASLDTRYFGESSSRFSDVPSSHFAYNAMALASERGIMKADLMTGQFNPGGAVSGADALLIIREIQKSLRITF